MNSIFQMSRARLAVGLLALTLGGLAAMPGSFGSALAQTSGTEDVVTNPSGSTTTTTTVGGTTTTTTTTGQTSTTTTKADGSSSTVVTIPGAGTLTLSTPATGGPPTVTVAPANPNANFSVPVEALALALSAPGGALNADDVISIVAAAFGEFSASVQMIPEHAVGVVNFAGAPGSLRAAKVFELTVKTKTGATSNLQKPIVMTWNFSPTELAEAGGDYANLKMFSRDEATKAWTIEAKQVAKTSTSVSF
ncbi:MAG: hypothetical protein WCI61_00080 [Chloroflexota bacterium]